MTHPLDELEDQVIELEQMLEQSNAEKQQWKQCAHMLADALEGFIISPYPANHSEAESWVSTAKNESQNALEQFKKLRDQ